MKKAKNKPTKRAGQSPARGYGPKGESVLGVLGRRGARWGSWVDERSGEPAESSEPAEAPMLPRRDVARYLLVTSCICHCTGQLLQLFWLCLVASPSVPFNVGPLTSLMTESKWTAQVRPLWFSSCLSPFSPIATTEVGQGRSGKG